MFYFVKNPGWLKKIFPQCIWDVKTVEKKLYLTFDDGPHPEETSFVLNELRKYSAEATFFCIGQNVAKYPELFQKIIDDGHSIGNHSWSHLDGWRTNNKTYFIDVRKGVEVLQTNLYRPPYGHITPAQISKLNKELKLRTIMWSIISGDFDQKISAEQCLQNIAENVFPGAIVVFHDSTKAAKNMRYALPKLLQKFSAEGYEFAKLTNDLFS